MVNLVSILKRTSVPVLIVVCGVVIAAWFHASRPRALPQPPQEKVWPVSIVTVERADVQPYIRAYGEVRAVREAELRAQVAGRLVSLNPDFRDGSRLAAGTELAVIDPFDYENRLVEQRAELERARAQLQELERELAYERELVDNAERQVALAQRSLARFEQLQLEGRESKKARDDAEAALASSEQARLQRVQNIARLQNRIAQQRAAYDKAQATLAGAEQELARTRVTAPFDGFVTGVRLALGQRVAVGESLARLLSANALEVRFELPEADFARLVGAAGGTQALEGRALEVVWRLGETAQRFPATLARLGAEIDPSVGGIALYAGVAADAADRGLRAGAFVEVRVPDVTYHDVFRLPSRALSEDGRLYRITDGRLAEVDAEIVRTLGDDILVRAEVSDGTAMVARAFAGIGPGLRARPL